MKNHMKLLGCIIAATVAALPYTKHAGKNCYDYHGAVNLNNSSSAPASYSAAECAAYCDADARCSCYVQDRKTMRCYTRAVCVIEQCDEDDGASGASSAGSAGNGGFDAYVREAPPVPSGALRNVLWVVYDDLRPDLSPYGANWMHTPNIQKLADSAVVFDRAFVQIAVCSPSRMSFSTGRRPNGTLAWCGSE